MKQRKQTKNLRITTRVIAVLITIAMIMGNAFYGGGTEVREVSASTLANTNVTSEAVTTSTDMLITNDSTSSVSLSSTDEITLSSDTAELMATKKSTIKKKNGKWYYVNSKGKISKKQGWKTNSKGLYTYYVSKKGNVTYQVKSGKLYKWKNNKWTKVSLKKNSTKKVAGKTFVTNSKGKIVRKTNAWKKVGSVKYYLNGKGIASYRIKSNKLYKWKNAKWVVVTKNTTIGNTTYKVNSSNGNIKETVIVDSSSSGSSSSSSSNSSSSSCSHNMVATSTKESDGYYTISSYNQYSGHSKICYYCVGCGKYFLTQSELQAHQDASFKAAYAASDYYDRLNSGETCWWCAGAYEKTTQYDNIAYAKVSIWYHYTLTTTYTCSKCGYTYDKTETKTGDIISMTIDPCASQSEAKTYIKNNYGTVKD